MNKRFYFWYSKASVAILNVNFRNKKMLIVRCPDSLKLFMALTALKYCYNRQNNRNACSSKYRNSIAKFKA